MAHVDPQALRVPPKRPLLEPQDELDARICSMLAGSTATADATAVHSPAYAASGQGVGGEVLRATNSAPVPEAGAPLPSTASSTWVDAHASEDASSSSSRSGSTSASQSASVPRERRGLGMGRAALSDEDMEATSYRFVRAPSAAASVSAEGSASSESAVRPAASASGEIRASASGELRASTSGEFRASASGEFRAATSGDFRVASSTEQLGGASGESGTRSSAAASEQPQGLDRGEAAERAARARAALWEHADQGFAQTAPTASLDPADVSTPPDGMPPLLSAADMLEDDVHEANAEDAADVHADPVAPAATEGVAGATGYADGDADGDADAGGSHPVPASLATEARHVEAERLAIELGAPLPPRPAPVLVTGDDDAHDDQIADDDREDSVGAVAHETSADERGGHRHSADGGRAARLEPDNDASEGAYAYAGGSPPADRTQATETDDPASAARSGWQMIREDLDVDAVEGRRTPEQMRPDDAMGAGTVASLNARGSVETGEGYGDASAGGAADSAAHPGRTAPVRELDVELHDVVGATAQIRGPAASTQPAQPAMPASNGLADVVAQAAENSRAHAAAEQAELDAKDNDLTARSEELRTGGAASSTPRGSMTWQPLAPPEPDELDAADLEDVEEIIEDADEVEDADDGDHGASASGLRAASDSGSGRLSESEGGAPPPPKPSAAPPAPARVEPVRGPTGALSSLGVTRKAWIEETFAEHSAALEPRRADDLCAAQVEFIVSRCGVKAPASVLDVGCGTGGHATHFAKAGYQVTGVDASLEVMLRATKAADAAGVQIEFLQGDVRQLPSDRHYDLVTCLGTTLGYFENPSDNQRAFASLTSAVAPGGALMIQLANRDFYASRMPLRSWWPAPRCLVQDEANFDSVASRLDIRRTIVFDDGRQFDHRISIRLYALHELLEIFQRFDFDVADVSGAMATPGRYFGDVSPELWVVARPRSRDHA